MQALDFAAPGLEGTKHAAGNRLAVHPGNHHDAAFDLFGIGGRLRARRAELGKLQRHRPDQRPRTWMVRHDLLDNGGHGRLR
ncbi:MAG: hypothetical protein ACR2RA_01535 [Geminicoccaceae bacterium]